MASLADALCAGGGGAVVIKRATAAAETNIGRASNLRRLESSGHICFGYMLT